MIMIVRKPRNTFIRFWRALFYLFFNSIKFTYYKFVEPRGDAAKVFLVNKNGELAILRIGYSHKSWVLPGGSVDRGEDPAEAASRELQEEAGIKVDNLEFISREQHQVYKKVFLNYFYAEIEEEDIVIDCQEIVDGGWFALDKVPDPHRSKLDAEIEYFKRWRETGEVKLELGSNY